MKPTPTPPAPVSPLPESTALTKPQASRTPRWWRLLLFTLTVGLGVSAWVLRDVIGLRGQAAFGFFAFILFVAGCSTNLRAVSWRTLGWGLALQLLLAVLVLKGSWSIDGREYSVYAAFERFGDVVKKFISYADEGAKFVFGSLSDPLLLGKALAPNASVDDQFKAGFVFALRALPPILFVAAFFTVLYHFGVLQWIVRVFARVMVYLMGTSGAETLSVAANVFMGQTEAPLIVKPYVPRMTNSELFTLMVSGMAHISGGMMAVYINYGADPVAVITTCVMACPCSLYLAKLFMPETSVPETSGTLHAHREKSPYVNAIDAAASGTSDGLRLAMNVAAMLIVFVAFVAMFNGLLGLIDKNWLMSRAWWPGAWVIPPDESLSLQWIFGKLFAPIAFLMGVELADTDKVGTLLGIKLAMNEHVAFLHMKTQFIPHHALSPRSFKLAAFALTGFANFASIGIQLGGIGAMAPERRHDLARLGMRALFVGFTATLVNAALAGIFLE